MPPAAPTPDDVLEKVDALGPPGTPVTTPEVTEGFDCTQRTIYNRLEALVEEGTLLTKKVGANSRVWWRPVDGDLRRNGGASDQRDPVSLQDGQTHSFTADSEMAERISEFDWTETPLGSIEEWPQELQVAVDIMLGADEAIGIYWGEDLTLLYNDTWRELIGDKHPQALGRPARAVFPEIWETIGPMFADVLDGNGARFDRERRLPLERDGQMEDAWFHYSANPIPMADGSVEGVFNVAVEVTDRVRAERELRKRKRESERRYRTVLNSMDEGFFLADVVFDSDGEPLDIFYRDSNPAATEFTGKEYTGRWLTEIDDDYEDYWFEIFGRVAATGEAERDVLYSGPDGIWCDVYVFKPQGMGSRRVAVIFQDVTERKQADEALRESEEKYRRLFESIVEGFCINEIIYDDDGETPLDFRIVEANPKFEEYTGLVDAEGKTVNEMGANLERFWYETYGEVARTREPSHFEHQVDAWGQWFSVSAFPHGDPEENRVAVLFDDITERKRRERHDQFLVELTETLQGLSDPVEIQHEAARLLGEHLNVDRAHYTEVGDDGDTFRIHSDFYRDDVPSVAGEHHLSDYGEYIVNTLRAGESLVLTDTGSAPELSDDDRVAYASGDTNATVAVPLVRDGRLVSFFSVDNAEPREWTDTEVEMVEETAERTWTAVERARTETALRESEERYRTLFESIDEGFCVVDVLFNEDGQPEDYRFRETNSAFEEQIGLVDAEGERMRELEPNHEDHWFETYGRIARTGEPERFTNEAEHLDDRWYDVYAFRIGQPEERKVAILFKDISERKEREQRLERQREQIDQLKDRLLEISPTGILTVDETGEITLANDRAAEILGWSGEDLTGRSHTAPEFEFVDQNEEPLPDAEVPSELVRTTGEPIFGVEVGATRPDGERIWLSMNAAPLHDDQADEAAETVVALDDITERKETEEALRESEERLEDDLAGMRRLYDLRASLANETDLHAAFDEIIEAANDFLGTDRGCIQLVSDDGERLEMAEYRGYDEQDPFVNYFSDEGSKSACDAARQNRERLVIEDVESFPGLQGTTDREVALENDIRATQSTPMLTRDGELVGVLSNQFPEPHRPSDRKLQFIDLLAWTAAEFVERHQAREELRESEERFRTLFDSISESMSEAFCVIEMPADGTVEASDGATEGTDTVAARDGPTDYRFVETNAAFEELVGLTDVVGERRCELDLAGDPPGFDACGDVLRTGDSKRVETNGEPHYDGWYDVRVFPYGGTDSGKVAMLIDDVTERKVAEQELRVSEARFRNVFENDMVPMAVWTEDGKITDANDAFLDLLGYTREELDAGKIDWTERKPPEYHQRDMQAVAEVKETGSCTPYEEEFIHKDGHRIPVLIGGGEFDPQREEGILFVIDITDRRAAEQKLAAELEAIERLQEISTQSIQETDWNVLYDTVLDTAVDMLDADFGSLQWFDQETDELELLTHRGFSREAESAWARVTPEHATTCGKALQTGERVVVSDVETSEFMAGTDDLETFRQAGIRAVQTTPLVSRSGEVLGMLSTHWTNPHEPSERDRHVLDVLARQVADFLQQRSVYEALSKSEASLERLNAATRELIDAEMATIADRVPLLVREVLDVEYASLWQYDDQRGALDEYATDVSPDLDGDAVEFPTEIADQVWETFVGSDVDVENDLDVPADVTSPVRSRAFVPLGRHGVVCLGATGANTFDERTVDLVETVASTVETAWNQADSEQKLARQNEELTRLERLNTLIRGIDQALVGADTREAIDEAVCEQLASSDLYESAWIATYDAETDTLRPQAWTGVDSRYLDDRAVTVGDASSDDPLVAAHRTREMQVVSDIAVDARAASWREDALERGVRSCITIPLVYEESTYGILTVDGRTPQPTDRVTGVLAELGGTIAHAIHALEASTTRRTDSVVELTLRSNEAAIPLARLARETNCDMTVEGLIPSATDDALTAFFTASGVSPDDLAAASADVLAIEDLVCLEDHADGGVFRARLTDPQLVSVLVPQSAVVHSISIESGTVTLVVDLPETDVVSEFLDDLRHRLPDLEPVARTMRSRSPETRYSLRMAVEDRLTARQLEVLRMSYESGFFQSPRAQTGEDLATTLGISPSTFTYHLREAQHRLCEIVFNTA